MTDILTKAPGVSGGKIRGIWLAGTYDTYFFIEYKIYMVLYYRTALYIYMYMWVCVLQRLSPFLVQKRQDNDINRLGVLL